MAEFKQGDEVVFLTEGGRTNRYRVGGEMIYRLEKGEIARDVPEEIRMVLLHDVRGFPVELRKESLEARLVAGTATHNKARVK